MSLKCTFGTYREGISVYNLVLLWWLSTSLPCMSIYACVFNNAGKVGTRGNPLVGTVGTWGCHCRMHSCKVSN